MILDTVISTLDEMVKLLEQLSNTDYSNKCGELSGSSIGEHTRHIIEMLQCLETQYHENLIDYDKRKRDMVTQTNVLYAISAIHKLKENLDKQNKLLWLKYKCNGKKVFLETNYQRELLYNLEHCIHHQALIKVALLNYTHINISEEFGVAPSTIAFKQQCVQ